MRIAGLVFGSIHKPGGWQVFALNLFRRLAERGHEVNVFVSQRQRLADLNGRGQAGTLRTRLIAPQARRFAEHAPAGLRLALRVQNRLVRPDVWQVIGAYPAGHVARALAGRAPLVLRAYGDDVQVEPSLDYGLRLSPRLEQRIARAVNSMDRLVAISPTMAACYRDLGVPEQRILEIPNGIDFARFQEAGDRDLTRRAWQLPSGRPVLLTVGRNHPKKGYAHIPAAARLLAERGHDPLWLVVGPRTRELAAAVAREGVEPYVRLHEGFGLEEDGGRVPSDALVSLYRAADVFVFPSLLETFGRVLIEAMAAGLPVVTTDAPGCRDVVTDRRTGLIVPRGDPAALAAAVHELLTDPALRRDLGANGVEHARRHDWSRITDAYEAVYESLLRR